MDVFALRERVIGEYRDYVRGFVSVREPRAQDYVDEYFKREALWPEPLVQLNPSFQPGSSVEDLVRDGTLHSDCGTMFRRRFVPDHFGLPIILHQHQTEAIAAAKNGKSYVLTTGTGSGKSLAYFVPIVDRILRAGPGRGIKAIVVYPMNALCNSQADALERFLKWGYPGGRGPVSFAKYTGQEDEAKRLAIQQNPPDILLTNYVMLELILTRGEEQPIINAAQGLEFLVLDELHTYRGRQGADVAMLARRVRERCGADTVRYVGTSATLAAEGTREQRQIEVAAVATRLFGAEVPPENVIGETLRRATDSRQPSAEELARELRRTDQFSSEYAELAKHPLAIWAETAFGLQTDELGRLERREPRSVTTVAEELSKLTRVDRTFCAVNLRSLLLAGSHAISSVNGFPLFAFRLHQFVSRGDTIYATPESLPNRDFSAEGQVFVPGDRSRHYYPMAFCRACGQDYLTVLLDGNDQIEARDIGEKSEETDVIAGLIVVKGPALLDPLADLTLLPEDWTEVYRGVTRIKPSARRRVPYLVRVKPDGQLVADGQPGGEDAWFLPSPFRFCIGCGITTPPGASSSSLAWLGYLPAVGVPTQRSCRSRRFGRSGVTMI